MVKEEKAKREKGRRKKVVLFLFPFYPYLLLLSFPFDAFPLLCEEAVARLSNAVAAYSCAGSVGFEEKLTADSIQLLKSQI